MIKKIKIQPKQNKLTGKKEKNKQKIPAIAYMEVSLVL